MTTVHDLAIFDTPWAFPRARVTGERLLVRHALHRADAIVAVSSFTAERVSALVGRPSVVVHSAPAPEMVPADRRRHGPGSGPATTCPDGSCCTWATSSRARTSPPWPRPVAGPGAPGADRPQPLGSPGPHRGAADRARAQGGTPALYGAATLVGYASRYEGFGLPPLEAMACGAAVVSTPVPAVVEVVGDAAATFLPGDVAGLSGTLRALLEDEGCRQDLAREGARRVSGLSWGDTARATAATYRSLGLAV